MMKSEINLDNFLELKKEASKLREKRDAQEKALVEVKKLRSFAFENNMDDEVVELFFEEALIHQHHYMETKADSDLIKMKEAVNEVKKYVQDRELVRWESRVARYLGRVADYEGKYLEAIDNYKEAISKVSLDPKYESNRAMGYEYKGFLFVDELKTKGVESSLEEVLELYRDYDRSAEALDLKKKDYTTWAIWRSAVLINLCSGIIELGKLSEYRNGVEDWLKQAESNFVVPEGTKVWSDFGFRKNEINQIRDSISKLERDE